MSKEKKPIFSDSYLDAVANEINQLYGKREQEINLTDRTKRNNLSYKNKKIAIHLYIAIFLFFHTSNSITDLLKFISSYTFKF